MDLKDKQEMFELNEGYSSSSSSFCGYYYSSFFNSSTSSSSSSSSVATIYDRNMHHDHHLRHEFMINNKIQDKESIHAVINTPNHTPNNATKINQTMLVYLQLSSSTGSTVRTSKPIKRFLYFLLLLLGMSVIILYTHAQLHDQHHQQQEQRQQSAYSFIRQPSFVFSSFKSSSSWSSLHRFLVQHEEQKQQDSTHSNSNNHHKSSHKSSLFPWDTSDSIGFILAFIGLFVAAGGGIGGGGILVPIYILFLHFRPKYAIPLSNTTVFGGSIANTWINSFKKHPYANHRPLIDWDFILVMEPLTIAGALIGTLINKFLPEDKVVILLVLLLSFIAYTTFQKAIQMYRKESVWIYRQEQSILQQMIIQQEEEDQEEEMIELISSACHRNNTMEDTETTFLVPQQLRGIDEKGRVHTDDDDDVQAKESQHKQQAKEIDCDIESKAILEQNTYISSTSTSSSPLILPKTTTTSINVSTTTDNINNNNNRLVDEKEQERIKIIQEEQYIPMNNVKILIILFLLILILNILKGGSSTGSSSFASPIGITCGSTLFWLTNLLMLLFIVYVTILARYYLLHKFQRKKSCDYIYVEGDVLWDSKTTLLYPLICCLAGFFSGMFGIGGGIVFGPLMLAMGMPPEVSSATSACMILFTSFTATTSFLVFGLLIYDYAIFCFLLGFVSTWIGQNVLTYFMKKSRRKSYIAFLIGGVVLISAFLMTIQSIISLAENSNSGSEQDANMRGGICS